ncbi:hypothetical protein BBOV_III007960 [Babesia bovis T2Bo]|uniref:Uncharacterized protein n=1 Tax=Babesia bovis TaxID=5865 RepID=A7AP72_BABBO|nr:hypothetical protein BBOV_III007960 [Babesia bovis T2Bo]EDO08356.1 hypothetical protein BBOV_III007960 [Babesia bovis T2Bo]|eukprot:XP_001611924.1 hypothetical protein [Babesia bovis T2Bo]
MNSSECATKQSSNSNECMCGSPHCWITYLSKLDKKDLPNIRISRCNRCEPCIAKYNVILHGDLPKKELNGKVEYDKKVYINKDKLEKTALKHNLSSSEESSARICDYIQEKEIDAEKVEQPPCNVETTEHIDKPDRIYQPFATEIPTSQDKTVIPKTETVVNKDAERVKDTSVNLDNIEISKERSSFTETTIPDSPKTIEIVLKPFITSFVDIDTGDITVKATEDKSMMTSVKANDRTSESQGGMESSCGIQDNVKVQPKMTIKTKIMGLCASQRPSTPRYTNDAPASNGNSKMGRCNYEVNISTRSPGGRTKTTENSSSKNGGATTGPLRKFPSNSSHAKCKQQVINSISSHSVGTVLTKSREDEYRNGRATVPRRASGVKSNRTGTTDERPPWNRLRSSDSLEIGKDALVPVNPGVLRRLRSSKGKSKTITKQRSISIQPCVTERASDLNDLSDMESKSRKKKTKGFNIGALGSSAMGIEADKAIYCTFRGVMLPPSRSRKHQTNRRVITAVDNSNNRPCEGCSTGYYQLDYTEPDSDEELYIPGLHQNRCYGNSNDTPVATRRIGLGICKECECPLDTNELPIQTVRCSAEEGNACECGISNDVKQITHYEPDPWDCLNTAPVHVCEHCSGLPDGSICPGTSTYNQWPSSTPFPNYNAVYNMPERPFIIYR